MCRQVRLEAADPPTLVRPAGDRAVAHDTVVERIALAQVPAQHGVDDALRLRAGEQRRGVDRPVHDGKWRGPRVVELVERHGDERRELRFERLRGQRLREC